MNPLMKTLKSKKFWKIFVIAIPVTFVYLIPVIFFRFFFQFTIEDLPADSFLHPIVPLMDFFVAFAPLGFLGMWMAFLMDRTLEEKRGVFNLLIALLILCGVFSVPVISFILIGSVTDFDTANMKGEAFVPTLIYIVLVPMILAVYGLYLAYKIGRLHFSDKNDNTEI